MSEPKRWKVDDIIHDYAGTTAAHYDTFVCDLAYDTAVRERDEARASAAQLAEALRAYVERAHPDEKLWDPQDYRNYERAAAALAVFDAKEKT